MTLFCSSRSIFVIIVIIIIIIITIIIITIIITTIVTIPSKSYLCYRTGNFRFLFFIFCSCVNIMFWSRPNHFLHFLNIMARKTYGTFFLVYIFLMNDSIILAIDINVMRRDSGIQENSIPFEMLQVPLLPFGIPGWSK